MIPSLSFRDQSFRCGGPACVWPSLPFTRCRSSGGRRTAVCEPTRCSFPAGPAPRVPQVSPSPRARLPPRRPCGPTTCTPRTRKRRNPAAGGTGHGRVGVRGAAGDPHPLGLPAEVQGRSSESRGRDGAAPALRALPTVACADRPGPPDPAPPPPAFQPPHLGALLTGRSSRVLAPGRPLSGSGT